MGDYVWTGNSGIPAWSVSNNWAGFQPPPTISSTANVIFPAGPTFTNAQLDQSYAVNKLTFDTSVLGYTAGAFNGARLSLGSGGLTNNSFVVQTLNAEAP